MLTIEPVLERGTKKTGQELVAKRLFIYPSRVGAYIVILILCVFSCPQVDSVEASHYLGIKEELCSRDTWSHRTQSKSCVILQVVHDDFMVVY
jgi:hypothetical protein